MLTTWTIVVGLSAFGFILLMMELFVIPGFGIAGVGGILAILGSVYYAAAHLGPWHGAVVFVVMFTVAIFVVTRVVRGGAFARLRNVSVSPGKVEYEDTAELAMRPEIGARGVALTPLRPSGTATINERRYDVVTEGVIVERGSAVEVTNVEGNVVTVSPV